MTTCVACCLVDAWTMSRQVAAEDRVDRGTKPHGQRAVGFPRCQVAPECSADGPRPPSKEVISRRGDLKPQRATGEQDDSEGAADWGRKDAQSLRNDAGFAESAAAEEACRSGLWTSETAVQAGRCRLLGVGQTGEEAPGASAWVVDEAHRDPEKGSC